MDSTTNSPLHPIKSLPPKEPAPDGPQEAENVDFNSALETLRGPAPSLEAYANYKAFSQPTLLRSERQQAGKKEFVTNVNKGKPIPPEDLIDLTNKSDDKDVDKYNQRTSGFPPLTKRQRLEDNNLPSDQTDSQKSPPPESCRSSPSVGQYKPHLLGPAKDLHDARSPGQITNPEASQTTPNTTCALPETVVTSADAASTRTGLELASTQSSANSTSDRVDTNLTTKTLTSPIPDTNTALPPSTGPEVNPIPSDGLLSFGPPIPPPANPSNAPLLVPPPAPMITLVRAAPSTGSAPQPPAASDQAAAPPSTPQPSPISFIKDVSVRGEVHVILQTFQGKLNRQKFTAAHQSIHSFLDC
ncbi:hypothetical protein PTTG_27355 [Puccinia triticina 1-1 BBBD Race 1]|uniref:Uncharacterized protein n=1 Tax=Puccinia triticina (isolate 1-1 / race 1 (BBBD)) TaxID=630390 RepID=A0A180GKV2_PUCT1|nr:hypothetical protein PTTG_27355 [Puccinia triticina 1-1 BBBD Race 1]